MTDRLGQQLGNYRLQRLLGRGGFAEVYLGEHTYLHKPAALKVLRLRLDEQETELFLREAQILARLEHPHIVRILDFSVQDGLPYLVMGYAVGGTLRTKHPAGTRLPLEPILTYITQVASALQYAHDQGLIHCDVKPENMLLDAHEQVLLADFGLARLQPTHSASTKALDPTLAGTTPYLAPEQVQGHPGPASDQYALGVAVYEWLSGQRPFRGTPLEVAMQHVSTPPPALHELVPNLPRAIDDIVLRALAKEPEDRFPSVQDFATALQHAAHPTGEAYVISDEPGTSTGAALSAGPFWKVPASFTSLVGREQDIAAVCTMLSRPEVRLLTLFGMGGIGKTRLAIQVATQLCAGFADGVCFVNLAPISDPNLVISSIARELGLQEAGAQPLEETVTAWLNDKHFLLLLDNFEQIVSAAPLLEDLLAVCPRLVILVTSREVLHLSAEHLFPIPPLSLPDLAQFPEHDQLTQYAAVSLFFQRAQAIKPDFQLNSSNAHAIAEICVRLDGLPLAIELAAARIRVLPPQALLTRLSQRLQVLTGRPPSMPQRQQTLRNTIQWSYDLLNTEEQRLFRCLSVFVGGCTLEAAEVVCGTSSDASDGIGSSMLDGITSLIDKSLLQQTEQEGEEPRFVMLETIREFGRAALSESGEVEIAQRTHAGYYLALAEEAEPQFAGAEQGRWLERLERDHENLRASLSWLIESHEMETALRLGGALWQFWRVRGYYSEGRTFLERALATNERVDASVRAKALVGAVSLAGFQGDFDWAEPLCQESLMLYQQIGDKRGIAYSRYLLAGVHFQRGDFATAHALLEKAVTLFQEVGDQERVSYALFYLARMFTTQGEYTSARTILEKSLAMHKELANKRGISLTLFQLARVLYLSQGDPAIMHAQLSQAQALFRELGFKGGIADCLSLSGQLALDQGDVPMARPMLEESLFLYREIGDRRGIAWSLSLLGSAVAMQEDYGAARAYCQESLTIAAEERNDREFVPFYLERLASVVALQREPGWAVRLWGVAEALREALGTPLPPVYRAEYEHSITAARAQLGEKAFAAARAEGRAMTLEQALAAQESVTLSPSALAEPSSVPHAPKAPTYPSGLTNREVEVLRLVAQGLTDAQVAEHLVISRRTVNFHLTSVYSKLGVSSRSAATRYALEHHLV